MTGLADVDGFYLFIQVCVWPRFPPLTTGRNCTPLSQSVNCNQLTYGTVIKCKASYESYFLFYRPLRSCGQGNVFTGVCLSTGEGAGCLPQYMLGCQNPLPPQTRQTPPTPRTRQTPPQTRQTPPQTRQTPPRPGRHPPPWTRQTPPQGRPGPHPRTRQTPLGSRLQHAVYERSVRILQECILVFLLFINKCVRYFVLFLLNFK